MPVAQNLYKVRVAKDAAGDFFRSVQKQRPAQYQGLYLVSPDGKVLASHQNFKSEKTWPQEVLSDLDAGIKAFGAVASRQTKPEDPLPYRGSGVSADGSVSLAIYLRYLLLGLQKEGFGPIVIDSLDLPASEWALFAPTQGALGSEWTLPDSLARKFCRVCGPGDEDSMPRPQEVTTAHLTGKVDSMENGIAYLTYQGEIAGIHKTQAKRLCRGDARLTGVGAYDIKARRMLSLTLIFDGLFNGVPPYDHPPAKYGVVVEWRPTTSNGP